MPPMWRPFSSAASLPSTSTDSQLKKDQARQQFVNELYLYWYYYYQLRSLTLWDYSASTPLETDFERVVKQ